MDHTYWNANKWQMSPDESAAFGPFLIPGPRITIDSVLFVLHGSEIRHNRHHVLFTSQISGSRPQVYVAYKSASEGFWRLLMNNAPGYYHKGIDYITSTFIHIELQKIIEQNYQTLPVAKFCDLYDTETYRSKSIIYRFDEIDKFSRRFNDPVLDVLQYACKNTPFKCLEGRYFTESVRSLQTNSRSGLRKKNVDKLNEILSEKLDLIKSRPVAWGSNEPANTEMRAVDVFDVYSKYVEEYFTLNSYKQKYICDISIQINNPMVEGKFIEHKEEFPIHVYQTEIRNKLTGDIYNLLYGIYMFQRLRYRIIINIVPAEATCLPIGVYSKYVSAGLLIYKIFEYIHQCAGFNTSKCNTQYVFIGDELTNVWPLPYLGLSSGGARKRKTLRRGRPNVQY